MDNGVFNLVDFVVNVIFVIESNVVLDRFVDFIVLLDGFQPIASTNTVAFTIGFTHVNEVGSLIIDALIGANHDLI